jgi:hypothetical protein
LSHDYHVWGIVTTRSTDSMVNRRKKERRKIRKKRKQINLAYFRNMLFYSLGIRGLLARTSFRPAKCKYRTLYSRFKGQKNKGPVRHALRTEGNQVGLHGRNVFLLGGGRSCNFREKQG